MKAQFSVPPHDRFLSLVAFYPACRPIHAQVLVGQKVQVFDSIEFTWCDGLVQEYDSATKLHKVVRSSFVFYSSGPTARWSVTSRERCRWCTIRWFRQSRKLFRGSSRQKVRQEWMPSICCCRTVVLISDSQWQNPIRARYSPLASRQLRTCRISCPQAP